MAIKNYEKAIEILTGAGATEEWAEKFLSNKNEKRARIMLIM